MKNQSNLFIAKNSLTLSYLLAGFIWTLTAYFSIGYRHGDEHFQILEFAGYLLGVNQAADMAWEFHHHMRPTLQPLITAILIKGFNTVGIVNPFTQMFFFRLFSSVLLFFALFRFLKSLQLHKNPVAVLTSYLFCVMPYIGARWSSEGLSASMLLLLISQLNQAKLLKHFFAAGIFAGLAFAFRFQAAFAIAGTVMWYLFNYKFNIKQVFVYALGALGICFISVVCDRYFYGQWVFAPYSYFYENIVLNKASNYGTDPWYYYMLHLLSDGLWLPGGLFLAALIVFSVRNPRSLPVLMGWMFWLGHTLVAHKETRFMYPVMVFMPYVAFVIYDSLSKNLLKKGIAYVMVLANVILLIPHIILPAAHEIALLKYLELEYPHQKFTLYGSGQSNPYDDYGLKNVFYGKKQVTFIGIETLPDNITNPALFISYRCNKDGQVDGKYRYKKVYQVYPQWITNHLNWFNWTSRASVMTLYELESVN